MRIVWSEEIKNNLYRGLEAELDNKTFFNASSLYHSTSEATNAHTASNLDGFASLGHISFSDTTLDSSYSGGGVKGMAFSNRIETDQKVNSVKDLSFNDRKIYKISDLLSANFAETTVIPLSTIPQNLSLVKRFEWKEVLFADVGDAFSMIKQRFFK